MRETYYYTKNNKVESIRISGKDGRDMDIKFQRFLTGGCGETSQTFGEFVDAVYMCQFLPRLALNTQENYRYYLRRHINPCLKDMSLKTIDIAAIQRLINGMCAERLSERTVERVVGLVGRILGLAADMGYIDSSPVKLSLLRISSRPATHHRALPPDVVRSARSKIAELDSPQQQIYASILMGTGLRREEIVGLMWEDLALDEGYGVVNRVVVYPGNGVAVVKSEAKTVRSKRTFLLPRSAVEILRRYKSDGFVIHGRDRNEPCPISTLGRLYRSVFKTLGISEYNNHDWRATYATTLKEAGMSTAQIADLLGHADTRMVETVYARTRHDSVMLYKDAVERVVE